MAAAISICQGIPAPFFYPSYADPSPPMPVLSAVQYYVSRRSRFLKMTLTKRIAVFAALWLIAGVLCAVFSDISAEAGESEFFGRLKLVYLAPLVAAWGVAFTLVHGHYDTWQQREHYEAVVRWCLIAVFVVHAVIAVTRQTRKQFIALSAIQILLIVASVPCVLFFFHYHAEHGHS